MRQDAPFFQAPQGRKIIVPRADHAIRWAMQPGAPASRNRASAASSSTHPRPLCGLPEKGSPFLRLIPLPPFCCAGPSYAPQAPIVQPARLWYNKTLRDTLYRENDLYAYHHTAGHRCYHAAAGPGAFGCVCSLRRARPALGLRRGNSGSGTPGRREPDAGGCHLSDPLPWRPHLWSAGPFADAGGAGPHKAACPAGSCRISGRLCGR